MKLKAFGVNEDDVIELTPAIMECETADEVCKIMNDYIERAKKRRM